MGLYRKLDDHYEVRIDQGRMALLGIGATLVLALVFLVGVVVGKSLWAPREPLAAKPPMERTVVKPETDPVAKPKYTFYDDVRNADGTVARQGSRPTQIQPRTVADKPAVEQERTTVTTAPPAPQASPKPVVKPERTQPKLPTSVFTVQVGSFKDRDAAERLKASLKRQGIEAQISTARVDTQAWYRLQVGSFSSRAKAEAYYRNQLVSKGVKGFVLAR